VSVCNVCKITESTVYGIVCDLPAENGLTSLILVSARAHKFTVVCLSVTDHVRELSCSGRRYYRTFHLDENRDTLYVGAM